ncbi:hypothetical protein B7494_g6826 [Chlorociboria aeruginascens]|nr:hypothetical protein B7494_g6826 [Chlorociboria aeruginascens]
MLRMAVQPSAHARPGVILPTPVVARLSSEHSIYEGLSMMYAVATLINDSDEVLYDQLGGRITDSAHPMNEREYGSRSNGRGHRQDRAYFYFPDLVIHVPGRYRIRISLMRMDYSTGEGAVTVEEQVDTRSIVVDQEGTNYSSPSELL